MKKSNKKIMVIVLMLLLAICLYYVAGTYAKYTATATANSTLDVAKWAVKIGEVDLASGAKDFKSELTLVSSNTKVKTGKIAPGTEASGTFTNEFTFFQNILINRN